MTSESSVERIKLMRGSRWPKDRHGDEIDVGDYLMFVNWSTYPMAALGKVIRIGKTGKVHVEAVKLHPRDEVREIEIKSANTSYRLSNATVSSFMMDKLSRL
jgi:hypothetical protein